MINPNAAVDRLVALWQSCPNLVEYLGGNEDVIKAYRDRFPSESSITDATLNPPPEGMASRPGILVVYQRTVLGNFQANESWKYGYSAFVFAPETTGPENPYSRILQLMMNDIPTLGNGQPFKRCEILPDLYELNPIRSGDFEFRRIVNGTEDFFELRFFLTEIGDSDELD